ncbi:prepilin-type N-terminal cleavage/methylation domain-containing protein [Cytobacillus firmus]|uniref:prepilin-type N-terminal cleavage/methylation domain-containing protein n=1 Tax=Cytobacillus firmus TaxID=1399 RepID=UPI002186DBE6|nr:prepilin-type N-terminal cleavage/methylation domain-containing protein [Cytobacillus firmus]URM33940.1 prepilin-type N-terminal cleavage/methylation domain-containing protein [Cytobacillus firmus]
MIKNLRKRLKDQKGLTLIELLAVIVILGIIAAIAIPSIGGLINKTEDDAKVAEGIQIINAAKLYTTSNAPKGGEELTKTELSDYLDNINDDSYKVTITKHDTTGKYSYSLSNHNSVKLVGGKDATSVSEDELLSKDTDE